jgi:hypothetical protein
MEIPEKRIKVRIKLLTEMLGTVSKDPTVYKTYIENKKPITVEEDESLTVEKAEDSGWSGFHKDEEGLFIYEYMIKGFLKQAGNVLKDILKIKALRSKIDDYVFIDPRRIHFNLNEPHGVLERSLRSMTPAGPRTSLKRSDLINAGTEIEFDLTLIPHKEITIETLITLLSYGKKIGLGQFRNGGYGRFEVISIIEQ